MQFRLGQNHRLASGFDHTMSEAPYLLLRHIEKKLKENLKTAHNATPNGPSLHLRRGDKAGNKAPKITSFRVLQTQLSVDRQRALVGFSILQGAGE